MKKVKKIWEENKVLLVLAIILAVCLAVFVIVAMTYFYGSNTGVYGNRLDITEKVKIRDELLNNVKVSLEENESVKSVSVIKKGLIIYISIYFVDETKIDSAKKIADSSLELFSEEELNVYDLEYTINCLSTSKVTGYTLMGARNSNGGGSIIWNNYNVVEESKK